MKTILALILSLAFVGVAYGQEQKDDKPVVQKEQAVCCVQCPYCCRQCPVLVDKDAEKVIVMAPMKPWMRHNWRMQKFDPRVLSEPQWDGRGPRFDGRGPHGYSRGYYNKFERGYGWGWGRFNR